MATRMEIRQLKYFAQVCEAGSFTAAAKQVGVSQPALSQSIIDLERQLDTVLLNRRTNGTYPTLEGEALLSFAHAIVRQHDRAISELSRIKDGRSGLVKLGVHSTYPRHLSIEAVKRFKTRYPKVEVRLLSTTSLRAEAERRLRSNEWDAALLPYFDDGEYNSDKNWKTQFEMQPIERTISHVYAKKGHPLTKRSTLSSDDLLEYPWVLDSVRSAKELARNLADRGSNRPFNCGLIADDFDAILETAVQTEMLCLAPERMVKASGRALVQLKQDIIACQPINWGIMTNLSVALSKPAEFFISSLVQP